LKFDRINGTINEEQDTKFFQELITNPNIGFESVENCSVCLQETKTKTACGHYLCLICWSKIKSETNEKPCPICREILYFKRT